MHKYDIDIYSIICFSHNGRKMEVILAETLTEAQRLGQCWDESNAGTHVIQRTLDNSSLKRRKW